MSKLPISHSLKTEFAEIGLTDNRIESKRPGMVGYQEKEIKGMCVAIVTNTYGNFFLTLDTGYTLRIHKELIEELHNRIIIDKL